MCWPVNWREAWRYSGGSLQVDNKVVLYFSIVSEKIHCCIVCVDKSGAPKEWAQYHKIFPAISCAAKPLPLPSLSVPHIVDCKCLI